jgi:hypothetical protein
MAHPGMTPVLADAREGPPGVYRAEIRLTMDGDWTLVASGTLADGSRFMAQHELRSLPQPP